MKSKLLFNSFSFFTAGIISYLRAAAAELIISIAFSFFFFTLTFWIERRKNRTIFE